MQKDAIEVFGRKKLAWSMKANALVGKIQKTKLVKLVNMANILMNRMITKLAIKVNMAGIVQIIILIMKSISHRLMIQHQIYV